MTLRDAGVDDPAAELSDCRQTAPRLAGIRVRHRNDVRAVAFPDRHTNNSRCLLDPRIDGRQVVLATVLLPVD